MRTKHPPGLTITILNSAKDTFSDIPLATPATYLRPPPKAHLSLPIDISLSRKRAREKQQQQQQQQPTREKQQAQHRQQYRYTHLPMRSHPPHPPPYPPAQYAGTLGTLGTPGLPLPHPACAALGHDTRLGWAGMAGLVACFPCGLMWLVARESVTCRRCAVQMPPQGIVD